MLGFYVGAQLIAIIAGATIGCYVIIKTNKNK
jgi:hypothetical protein